MPRPVQLSLDIGLNLFKHIISLWISAWSMAPDFDKCCKLNESFSKLGRINLLAFSRAASFDAKSVPLLMSLALKRTIRKYDSHWPLSISATSSSIRNLNWIHPVGFPLNSSGVKRKLTGNPRNLWTESLFCKSRSRTIFDKNSVSFTFLSATILVLLLKRPPLGRKRIRKISLGDSYFTA